MNYIEIPFIKFNISLLFEDPEKRPLYLFSAFRGLFGNTLKRFSCVARKFSSCQECPLNQDCAYGYLFETPRPKQAQRLRLYPFVPHPFAFSIPFIKEKKSPINIGLVLIGKGIKYFPHVILTIKQMGNRGIGKNKAKFRITSIIDLENKKELYKNGKLSPPSLYNIKKEFLNLSTPLEVEFLSPVRLRYQGRIIGAKSFAFHILIRNLLRRISLLSYFHAQKNCLIDFKKLILDAHSIKIYENKLKLVHFYRYSSRQKQKIKMGGLIGKISFIGDLSSYFPLLLLGEKLQVGKNTSFGLGAYKILHGNK